MHYVIYKCHSGTCKAFVNASRYQITYDNNDVDEMGSLSASRFLF